MRCHRRQVEPEWATIHRELKRKHVTLSILWDEYVEHNPDGYRYSRFCELYRSWEAKLSVTMRQTHVGGDKLFVDYAGDTVAVIVDRLTGECARHKSSSQSWVPRASPTSRRPGRKRLAIGSVPTLRADRRRQKLALVSPRPPIDASARWAPIVPGHRGRSTRRP